MLGNLAAQGAALNHAEADVLYPITAQPNGRPTPGSAEMSMSSATHTYLRAGILIDGFGKRGLSSSSIVA